MFIPDTYIGCKPRPPAKCPYQGTAEDRWKTTIYPKCTCSMKRCNEYNGYCPIRDN